MITLGGWEYIKPKVVWLNCESNLIMNNFKKHFLDIFGGCGKMPTSSHSCWWDLRTMSLNVSV